MSKHLLTTTDNQKKVVKITKTVTYSFNPKSNFKEINAKKVTIYDKDFLSSYVAHKLENKYKELLFVIKEILDSDEDSEESSMRCMDMISKYEDIVENKYKHYLKIKNYQRFIDKITLLRKLVEVNTIVNEEEIEYSIGGGRR